MDKTKTPAIRELTAEELKQAGGGAIFMKVEGIKGR
jgi:hypothetical protein